MNKNTTYRRWQAMTTKFNFLDTPFVSEAKNPVWQRIYESYRKQNNGEYQNYFDVLKNLINEVEHHYNRTIAGWDTYCTTLDDQSIVCNRFLTEYVRIKTLLQNLYVDVKNTLFHVNLSSKQRRSMEVLIGDINSSIDELNKSIKMLEKFISPFCEAKFYSGDNKSLFELEQLMIKQQGCVVENVQGTCGLTSIVNVFALLGYTISERELILQAIAEGNCRYNPIHSTMTLVDQDKTIAKNGGTNFYDRENIIKKHQYECISMPRQSLIQIQAMLAKGYKAIINVDSDLLEFPNTMHSLETLKTNHVITILGLELDEFEKPIGIWFHDTGIMSYTGNLFFCNAFDYTLFQLTNTSIVQYVKK
jgi:hypothetical protein